MTSFRRMKRRVAFYLLLACFGLIIWRQLLSGYSWLGKSVERRDLHRQVHDYWNLNDRSFAAKEPRRRACRRLDICYPVFSLCSRNSGDESLVHVDLVGRRDEWGPHQLGLVVPYRNRFEELREFVPFMHKYLDKKKINRKILVINQVDNHRFNRASLINVGFFAAVNDSCDYIAMHDVDLLPVNEDLNYGYPEIGPFHVAAPDLHPKYHYEKFVGGILILSVKQFEELNGMSNKFWGWGREDDEFYMRIVDAGFEIFRHGVEIKTGYDTFRHIHGPERPRDYKTLPGQRKAKFERDQMTGLSTLQYDLVRHQELTVDGYPFTVIDVMLHCDHEETPWCDLPKQKSSDS